MTDKAFEEWKDENRDFYDAMRGDRKATERVIKDFSRMVHKWANFYKTYCPDYVYDDMVQEGILGIIGGIRSFDTKKRTTNGDLINPSTWLWWKIRASVQKSYRKNYKMFVEFSMFRVSEEELAEVECSRSNKDDLTSLDVEDLLIEGCGSLSSRRALIVRDKFGLLGNTPLRNKDILKKHGISGQAVNNHLKRFFNKIKDKYPELKETLG